MVREINPIPVTIPKQRLLRRIGGLGTSGVSARTKAQMQKAIREIRQRADARAVYRVLPVRKKNGSVTLDGGVSFKNQKLVDVLHPCDKAAVFLVTIGHEVDRLVRRRMARRPHYGFILDSAASVAADSAAQYVHDSIGQELGEGEGTTLRYSPGYCDWPLKDQEKLFEVLPNSMIDVKLSENSFMSPRKSVSGVIGICPAGLAKSSGNACMKCPNTNCPYRRTS